MDNLFPASNGIPGAADLARVTDFLQTVQPSDALVTVAAATPQTVNLTVSGLLPNTTTVQQAVIAEQMAAFRRLSRVSGSDEVFPSMPFLAWPAVYSQQWLWGALNDAVGEQSATLVLPNADIPLGAGQLPVLGTVTFE
jgi:Baseplate J-like protein